MNEERIGKLTIDDRIKINGVLELTPEGSFPVMDARLDLKADKTELGDAEEAINQALDLKADITALNQEVNTINQTIDDLEETFTNAQDALNQALSEEVVVVKGDLASNVVRIETLEQDLPSNVIRIENLEVDLPSNVIRIETLERDLPSNVVRIETLEQDLPSNVVRIENLERDLPSNVVRIENLERDLPSNVIRIENLERDLPSNVLRIETLEQDLPSNVLRIETLEQDLPSNVLRIENLERDLPSNVVRIETLETDNEVNSGRIQVIEDTYATTAYADSIDNGQWVSDNFLSAPTKYDALTGSIPSGKWTNGEEYVSHRLSGYATTNYVNEVALSAVAVEGIVSTAITGLATTSALGETTAMVEAVATDLVAHQEYASLTYVSKPLDWLEEGLTLKEYVEGKSEDAVRQPSDWGTNETLDAYVVAKTQNIPTPATISGSSPTIQFITHSGAYGSTQSPDWKIYSTPFSTLAIHRKSTGDPLGAIFDYDGDVVNIGANGDVNIPKTDGLKVNDELVAIKSQHYTKTEIDNKLTPLATTENVYTKAETDNINSETRAWSDARFASISTTYTKAEVDTALSEKADASTLNDYTPTLALTPLLDAKAPQSTTYTKSEVDTALQNVSVDLSDYYTKTEVDTALGGVSVDLSGYYTKTEANNKFLSTDANGNLTIPGAFTAGGDITAFSDRRVKSDLARIEGAMDKILTLGGYTFTQNDRRSTGLIAQEVLEVLPEAVHQVQNGVDGEQLYTLAYGNLAGMFVEALKELKGEVEDLKKKIGV